MSVRPDAPEKLAKVIRHRPVCTDGGLSLVGTITLLGPEFDSDANLNLSLALIAEQCVDISDVLPLHVDLGQRHP